MAGMSVGGGLFLAASLWSLGRSWKAGAGRRVGEAFRHPISWFSLALFAVSLLSLAWAWISPPLGEPVSGFKELKKFHHFLYPPFIALAFLYTADEMEKHPFWKFWGAMGVFCALLACAQFFGADLFPAAWLESRFFRAVGSTGRFHGQGLMFFHLSFAACLNFVAAAGLARLLWPLKWDGKKERLFWLAVTAAGFLSVFLSYSRIAMAAILVIAAFLFFLKKPVWGVMMAVVLAIASLALWREVPSLRERFEQASGSNAERKLMWESAWDMFEDRPWLGFGFGRSGAYTPVYAEKILGSKPWFTSHAHNNVLDALASTGALGLLAFLGWWGAIFISAWRSFRSATEKWLPAAALGAFLAFQVNGLTQVNFWDGKSQHTMMIWAGVVLALSLRRRRQDEQSFRR
jgi:O-antigen ligase